MFTKFSQEYEFSEEINTFVNQAILDTVSHTPSNPSPLIHACLDSDLSILASDKYEEYTKSIWFEYKHYDDEAYWHGRTKVLQTFLERPWIFYTDWIEELYREKANENMWREID